MEKMYKFFDGNPWLNILFLIIALLGIFLTFYFYFKALKTKSPVFSISTTNLINSNISTIQNIEIKYKDTVLKNLSMTKVCFWNSGKEPIRKQDIAIANPLAIRSKKDVKIYDFELVYGNPVNNVLFSRLDDNNIQVSFDFLDFQDGFAINIYHNGKSNKDFSIEGKLIGAENIRYGINNQVIFSKLEFIGKPVDYLIAQKGIFAKVLLIPVFAITLAIIFPLMILTGPLDYLRDRFIKRQIPKQFYIPD